VSLSDLTRNLYAEPPGEFIAARDVAAKAARAAGDEELAAALKALRRPTVSAGLLNLLARERRDAVIALAEVGPKLRAAQQDGAGDTVRALMRDRKDLTAQLGRDAADLADEQGLTVTAGVEREIQTALLAAVSEPTVATALLAACLSTAPIATGLGYAEPTGSTEPTGSPKRAAGRATKKTPPISSASAQRAAAARDRLQQAEKAQRDAERAADKLGQRAAAADTEVAELDHALQRALDEARILDRGRTAAERRAAAAREAHADAVARVDTLRAKAATARDQAHRLS
jgi:hypothetical protein